MLHETFLESADIKSLEQLICIGLTVACRASAISTGERSDLFW